MTDQKAMAYVNMYGVLGALENLCGLDAKAKEILKEIKKPVASAMALATGWKGRLKSILSRI